MIRWLEAVVAIPLVAAVVARRRWRQGKPRGLTSQTLSDVNAGIRAGNSSERLTIVALPAAIQGRTVAEAAEVLAKAAADQIQCRYG